MHVPRTKQAGVSFVNNYNNSVISGLNALKLRMHVGSRLATYLHMAQLGYYYACTRARVVLRYRERLQPISLKCGIPIETVQLGVVQKLVAT